jgi:hypothetical protein
MVERQLREHRMIHRIIHESPGWARCSCDKWSIALPVPEVLTHLAQAYLDRRVYEAYRGHVLDTKGGERGRMTRARSVVQARSPGRLMNHGPQKKENYVSTPVSQAVVS